MEQQRAPMSPLGEMVFGIGQSMANASAESYAQGVVEGRRQSAKRIAHLEAALEECLEYFEDRYDAVDGDYGEPRANREMQMGQTIEMALGRRP